MRTKQSDSSLAQKICTRVPDGGTTTVSSLSKNLTFYLFPVCSFYLQSIGIICSNISPNLTLQNYEIRLHGMAEERKQEEPVKNHERNKALLLQKVPNSAVDKQETEYNL